MPVGGALAWKRLGTPRLLATSEERQGTGARINITSFGSSWEKLSTLHKNESIDHYRQLRK